MSEATIRFMHRVAAANRVNLDGEILSKLTAENDAVTIALRSNEQCWVDVLWAG